MGSIRSRPRGPEDYPPPLAAAAAFSAFSLEKPRDIWTTMITHIETAAIMTT